MRPDCCKQPPAELSSSPRRRRAAAARAGRRPRRARRRRRRRLAAAAAGVRLGLCRPCPTQEHRTRLRPCHQCRPVFALCLLCVCLNCVSTLCVRCVSCACVFAGAFALKKSRCPPLLRSLCTGSRGRGRKRRRLLGSLAARWGPACVFAYLWLRVLGQLGLLCMLHAVCLFPRHAHCLTAHATETASSSTRRYNIIM